MATQLFLVNDLRSDDSESSDTDFALSTTRGTGSVSDSVNTVAGPTSGVQIASGAPRSWWYRVNAVTISGAITKNLWFRESNMAANAGAQVIIDRHDSALAFVSTVANHERGVELVVGVDTAENWATGTVTSTTFADGDYIRVRVYINDVGTMASGHTATFNYDGPTAAALGDSYVTFTETIDAYVPAAPRVPYSTPMPQLLAQ